ncbi:MAG TPA: SDR family NAD(P)-dependent oxidoreductase [Acidimicrobiales bacterium]|nr:SDR family NAD(P)-dependent oxidoreductase [Acidimicrobiales bacterium]
MELKGKRVLVTGASSGIGAAIALELARAEAILGLCARRTELLERVLAECRQSSPESIAWTVDLGDLGGIERFARRAEAELGAVDVLINNAGLVRTTRLPGAEWALIEELNRVNYLSPVKLTLALLPAMLARGAGQVLTISSVGARLAPPAESGYAASKAALSAFFESTAADLWYSGVTFHLLYPGLIHVSDEPFDADHARLHTGMEGLPASAVADAARRQLEEGTFEVYVPESFKGMFSTRAGDVASNIAFTADWARRQFGDGPPAP